MRKLLSVFLLAGWVSLTGSFAQNWDWGGPLDPLQSKFEIRHYRLELEIFPDDQFISGKNTISFIAAEKLDTLRLNFIDEYHVDKVIMGGEEVGFNHTSDVLDVFPEDCTCEEVAIYYSGKTPIAQNPPWTGGFTWEKDKLNNYWMGLSSQGEGAKIFMPALDHPSSEPAEGVDLYFTVPKPYFVAANGRLKGEKRVDDKIVYHWATSYPINNYNINFTVGVFHEERMDFKSISGEDIPMHVYVLQENRAKAKELLAILKVSTETHEKYFGAFPFPKDKIAVVETPYLGMEHQTINAYGNNFQFVQVGDTSYDWLLHHELGHEWFGNKVSVGDWADMWIHEGITAFGDWMFYWEHGGADAYFEKVKSENRNILHQRPVLSPKNSTEEEAYHSDIYSKGAYIIHSLRWLIGDEVFFPMLKAFAADDRFTYQNRLDTDDFVSFVQEYTVSDYRGFFELYLKTTKLPKVKISKKGKTGYQVSLQGIDFQMPVEVQTSFGVQVVTLGKTPVLIKSDSMPEVDPRGWLMLVK